MTGEPTEVGGQRPVPPRSFGHPLLGATPYGGEPVYVPRTRAPWVSAFAPSAAPAPAPTRIGRVGIALIGLLALALLAVGVVGSVATLDHLGKTWLGPSTSTAAATSPVNPDTSAVTTAAAAALLSARSRAVLAGDEPGFLAGVDPTDEQFVARQRELFTSLESLPLGYARWTVRPNSSYNRPTLATQYGAPVFVTDAEFDYQLKGYDSSPVANAETLTFVRREGRWELGGDSDLDNLLPEGGHAEPWDVGPIEVVRGTSSLVIGTPEDHDALPELARVADQAAAAVAFRWGEGWSHKVVVYAPRDPRVISTYFRSDLQSVDSASAVQIEVFNAVPEWDNRAESVGSRVIFNPTYTQPGDSELPVLLRHEFTHVATRSATSEATPTWLIEGFAEYTAYLGQPGDRGVSREVVDAAAAGQLMPYLPSSIDFYSDGNNYDRSWLLCLYIGQRYGAAKVTALYEFPASTGGTDPGEAARLAIRSVLGITQEQLIKNVNDWARTAVPAM